MTRQPHRESSRRHLATVALVFALVMATAGCDRLWPSCGPLSAIEPHLHDVVPLRVIHLDQWWRSPGASLCIAGIRVYDGLFEIVGYADADATFAPWARDVVWLDADDGKRYLQVTNGQAPPRGWSLVYTPPQSPTNATGDLLLGVHTLHATAFGTTWEATLTLP